MMRLWLASVALAGLLPVHAAEMTMTIYPASTGLAVLLQGATVCLAGAKFSWSQADGPVRNAATGAFVVVRNGVQPAFDGVYRIVAIAQSITDGKIVTLFHAECTTRLS